MVTASHNPADYNGMKLVREGARPISGDSGLDQIRAMAEKGLPPPVAEPGPRQDADIMPAYVQHLLGYLDTAALRPLKIVVNPGNGGAGLVIDELARHLPFEFSKVHFEPDGSFPNGVPNPLLPDNRAPTIEAIRETGADLGIAWDGDFDRCFLFDEQGQFVEGYYIVGLLAKALLARQPGRASCMTPGLPGTLKPKWRSTAGSRSSAKPGMPLSRSACGPRTRSTAGR